MTPKGVEHVERIGYVPRTHKRVRKSPFKARFRVGSARLAHRHVSARAVLVDGRHARLSRTVHPCARVAGGR